jgi:hypothetical protein
VVTLVCIYVALALVPAASARFVLASKDVAAPVVIGPDEPAFIRVAANDLVTDVRKITGRTLPPAVSTDACKPACVVLASASVPSSKRIIERLAPDVLRSLRPQGSRTVLAGDVLLIAGADPHGTMFGLYDFIAHELKIDPMYFWKSRAPKAQPELAWDRIDRALDAPSFRWRGWFINDEDLLTEWKDGGGPRFIDYPFYSQVAASDVIERVLEAAVRLKFNLIIPASFTDIDNPAEERLIQQATRRGLQVSMHHVEPMGVSAFAFFNYWRARGKQVEYSYAANPQLFEEVWRHYARRWSKYPGVVWQVGLRGIADRPVWDADRHAPKDDAGRGAMISRAIAAQMAIIREVDPRPKPPVTTTLWMEGAYLLQGGHLKLPEDVTVVFADNGPGWNWQRDFHEVPREKHRTYGVYYHHAVWGWGPHLVQAVPPRKTYSMIREAYEKNGGTYAIFNVANVREFALGLAATSEMTWRIDTFDPDEFLRRWAGNAEPAYRAFFDAYVLHEKRGTPDLLDGLALHEGERIVQALLQGRNDELFAPGTEAREFVARSFPQLRRTGEEPPPLLAKRVREQIARLDRAIAAAEPLRGDAFFDSNLLGQAHILRGICRWVGALAEASIAVREGRSARPHLSAAMEGFAEIRKGQAMNSRGEWHDWYRGDKKMNLNRAEAWTRQLLERL